VAHAVDSSEESGVEETGDVVDGEAFPGRSEGQRTRGGDSEDQEEDWAGDGA
jgi:hypothetical protein